MADFCYFGHTLLHMTRVCQPARCVLTHTVYITLFTLPLYLPKTNFFSFTDGNNVDDPRGSILLARFQSLLVIFHVFKTAAYAMYCQRRAHPSLSHPHIQKLHEHVSQSTLPGRITRFFSFFALTSILRFMSLLPNTQFNHLL